MSNPFDYSLLQQLLNDPTFFNLDLLEASVSAQLRNAELHQAKLSEKLES